VGKIPDVGIVREILASGLLGRGGCFPTEKKGENECFKAFLSSLILAKHPFQNNEFVIALG
jgi:hypothetical protein